MECSSSGTQGGSVGLLESESRLSSAVWRTAVEVLCRARVLMGGGGHEEGSWGGEVIGGRGLGRS